MMLATVISINKLQPFLDTTFDFTAIFTQAIEGRTLFYSLGTFGDIKITFIIPISHTTSPLLQVPSNKHIL